VHKKKAFTLIELLVVIAIIALLLSIMMPALQRIKEQARRVVCRSNLHQWSLAVTGYAAANDGVYCSAFGYKDAVGNLYFVVPNEIWFENANSGGVAANEHSGQISCELMAPYMQSNFNPRGYSAQDIRDMGLTSADPEAQDIILKGAWVCPAFRAPKKEVLDDNLGRIKEPRAFMRVRYAYFGRSDLWPQGAATNPQDFGRKSPSSRHLLMSDSIYNWSNWGVDYNHSVSGKRSQVEWTQPGDEPGISGLNKLFGDGSAIWKDRRDFQRSVSNPILSDISSGTGRQVKGGTSGYAAAAHNYY